MGILLFRQAICGVLELIQSGIELGLVFVVAMVTFSAPQASGSSSKGLLIL